MRYMFLIYSRESDMAVISPSDMDELKAAHWAVIDETRSKGIFHGAEPLHSTTTATTIRLADGKPLVLDGPYAETKEQLAGYYILDCADLDEALEWAAKIPTGCGGATGCIEVRPIHEFPKGPQGEPLLAPGRG